MKQTKIICDKCKEDITGTHDKIHVVIGNPDNPMYEFDFCGKCYGNFIRTIGSWIQGEE